MPRQMPRSVRGLAIGPSAVTVRRVDERSLDLSMERGFLSGPLGSLFRAPREPFTAGEVFSVPGMTATIAGLTPEGVPAT